ncbi:hypothetical protein UFOVP639_16 [uncultured Caudovirales phage]|uniref:Uncharacterized protein n=1 Tax=uncultured Caudovirales phage TaxID=2100421 RepID=A0A6J5N5E9_9CAUD|nr:hypothetical protein UFOVP639_16 [uncultured Caudovirales phage]
MQLKEQQRNYYKTLQDYAALIEATLKEQAPSFSGSLRDSITGEIEFDQNGTANVGIYMAEHGTYINEGVNGAKSSYIENKNSRFRYKDKMPPISALQAWANAKSINPWALRYSIYTKGIRRNPFIERSFSDGTLDKMATDIAESIWTDFYVSLEDKKINK